MQQFRIKLLIVRMSQKIALAQLGFIDDSNRQLMLTITQSSVIESLETISINCLDYVLERTEQEILNGIQSSHPLAIEFDNIQIKELKNV